MGIPAENTEAKVWLITRKIGGQGWRIVHSDKQAPFCFHVANSDEVIDYRAVYAIHQDEDEAKRAVRRCKKINGIMNPCVADASALVTSLEQRLDEALRQAAQPLLEEPGNDGTN